MTDSRIERLSFDPASLNSWSLEDHRRLNWPVVYTLDNASTIYVGETGNVVGRMRQHLATESKQGLKVVQVIVDDTFNKSACLDLESFLIRMFAGDGRYTVLNRNEGITDADYYDRAQYQKVFDDIFHELREAGYFSRTIPQIVNSDLFKLSPFKALTLEQAGAVADILEGLGQDLETEEPSTIVVRGEPGTGKTILAIYLMKLLVDIQNFTEGDDPSPDSLFADYFLEDYRQKVAGFRIGLVVPQQSLRESIKAVFKKTPGLHPSMVLTPFDVGLGAARFDLLIVDEAHRLTQLASQAMGTLTSAFRKINLKLFGQDADTRTQLDWIRARSTHQIFLLDTGQRVRPADVSSASLQSLVGTAEQIQRVYRLANQMRVEAGSDYVGYVRQSLGPLPPSPRGFGDYDLRFFDDFDEMYDLIQVKDREEGLSRLLAGYAWPWLSKKSPQTPDITLGSHQLFWNRRAKDWVNNSNPAEEVGSIHTIQGYDLNYAGVIIGKDLRLNPTTGRIFFDRSNYFDRRGKADNHIVGVRYTDEDLLEFVTNIYGVLLTRGIRGTYIYVCDEPLREHLRPLFTPGAHAESSTA